MSDEIANKRKYICVSRLPHVQKNLNTFRATFQKPSHIYKFLKEIWKHNPVYLNRNLSYISKHRNRRAGVSRDKRIEFLARRLRTKSTRNGVSGSGSDSKTSLANNLASMDTFGTLNNSENLCYYNWICTDPARTSQKTKSSGYICPWCERDLHHLDSLMTHLRCSHPRFCSNLVQEDNQPVIEMTLNPTYDGSYCGFKYPGHDLRRDFKFTPSAPERRMHFTQIIFFRPKRKATTLLPRGAARIRAANCEMACDDDEVDVDVCSGRLYYHTSTCLPIKISEVDVDSEADLDPEWLCERTQLMIEEFTDVNEGEKEILKLWNLHIMKNYKYKGDSMIRQACHDFVDLHGQTILCKKLYKNFTLHLANLYDFGLIGSRDMLECTRRLKRMSVSINSNPTRPSKVKLERLSNDHCQNALFFLA